MPEGGFSGRGLGRHGAFETFRIFRRLHRILMYFGEFVVPYKSEVSELGPRGLRMPRTMTKLHTSQLSIKRPQS